MSRLLLIFISILFSAILAKGQNLTNIGTDFRIAFPPNHSTSATLHLFISSVFSTSGTISSAFPGVDQPFTVSPGVVSEVIIPSGARLSPGVEDKGIRIMAQDPVAVYGLNLVMASTDAFMALPVTSLGVDYMVLTYKTTVNNKGSSFSVVATQDGTVVNIFNRETGNTYDITLNAGQTYHESVTTIGADLTGSTIHANHPVSVFGSVELANVPNGCSYADYIVEQLFPVTAWGKRFITVPSAGRDASGDIFRILAKEDNTQVSVNGSLVATLNTGIYHEANLAGYNSITTSKPALVAQYAKGTQCSGNTIGDPFMMLIPPREQFLTSYTVCTVVPFTSHWVNIVAPSYALGTILMDGLAISAASFFPVGTTSYHGAQIPITEGSHTFTSSIPFGVFVYGWTNVNSYGYPGGGSMSPVGTVNSVTLSPSNVSGILNVSTVCLTAHVEDDLNNPVAGVLVTFNVSGLNPLTGTGYTNSMGDAEYCYTQTGTASTTDVVQAEIFGFTSSNSIVDWSYLPPPCMNPDAGGTIGDPQSGCIPFVPAPLNSLTPATGYTGVLEYQWQQSGEGPSTGFTAIPVSNTASLIPATLNQTTWFRRLAKVECIAGWDGAVVSNVIEIVVLPVPEISFSACFDVITTTEAKPVVLKGGLPRGGEYSGAGVNSLTGTFNPAQAGVGTHTLTYSYTNIHGCEAAATCNVQCANVSAFSCGSLLTDIRDGKSYPTVQIGSRCWMQKNLEYGIAISENIPQTDNCVPEKYSRLVTNVTIVTDVTIVTTVTTVTDNALYQWDELMNYDPTPGAQGVCPPGWHIPTESDWSMLFNFYNGKSRAGKPLQDTFVNGFQTLMSGVLYSQNFLKFGDFGTMFWSSTASGIDRAMAHGLNVWNYSVSDYAAGRGNALAVRCLRD